jgi:PAS domain S-box-containing protein
MQKSLRILLLEDNPLDAEMIQRLLKQENFLFDCRHVVNKKQFVLGLDEFLPDLIISDHSLPQFNSVLALEMAREKFPDIPFIMVTGTVSEEFAASIIKQGADDYILKDRMARLPAAIAKAFQQRQGEKEKKLAADRLKKSEENYRTIMERVSDGFVALDKDWYYTYVNKKAGEILNRDPASLMGKDIWQEFPDGIGEPFFSAYHKAMRSQQYIHLEEYYTPFDVWLENHIYPSQEGLSIFFRNITERKKGEQKIIQSEENLKAIFDNASEGFILLDNHALIKAFNGRAAEEAVFNIAIPLEVGKSIFEYVARERQDFFNSIIQQVCAGETVVYDLQYQSKHGSSNWVNFCYNPVWTDKSINGICITVRNITEKKVAEQQKEFDHNNLHALINNTKDMLWSIDLNLNLITSNNAFNEAVKQVSGTTPVTGSNILTTFFNEKESDRYRRYYARAFAGETFTIVEHNIHPPEFWSEISFYPIYEKQVVIGTACLSRDITERKKAEAELDRLEQERLKSKMQEQKKITIAMLQAQEKERTAIGYELHDNVNQILVVSNLVLSMIKGNPEKSEELISSAIAHIKKAIEENRKIAHVFVAPNLQTETLVDLLQKLMNEMLNPSGIKTSLSFKGFRGELLTDDRKINVYRIAQEQCSNIVKYAKASTVKIILTTADGIFRMVIADNGIGMDTTLRSAGIGLRNIKDRVGLFNGESVITSSPGNGFRVEITIPL